MQENLFIWHFHPVAILESKEVELLVLQFKRGGILTLNFSE